jgi:hypothetical protein
MPQAGYDSELLAVLRQAALTDQQTFLVQTILERIEPDALLSKHASVRRGFVSRAAAGRGRDRFPLAHPAAKGQTAEISL